VIGSVGRETSLDRVVVRAGSSQLEVAKLSEGGLIEAEVRGRPVLYQVIDVEVEGARPEGEGRSKRLRLMARKLGHWEEESESGPEVPAGSRRLCHRLDWSASEPGPFGSDVAKTTGSKPDMPQNSAKRELTAANSTPF
jgi:DNA-binding transcriptional ArsR family regulator